MNAKEFMKRLLNTKLNINKLLEAKGIKSTNDYSFLENNKETIDNLLYLVLSGSHAYGTNIPGSDIDVRVIRMNTKDSILLLSNGKVHTNVETDTATYTINSIVKMFASGNPNVLEFLGSIDRNALYIHPYFQENIIKNKDLFISRNVFFSFGGFMKSQVNRFNNKINRNDEETIIENLMRSIEKSSKHIEEEYGIVLGKDVIVNAENKLFELSFKDISLDVLPQCLNELSTICKNAKKLNQITKDQKYVLDHGRVNKHIMHYVRLADMGVEILQTGEINTYREKDHDLLMSIRNNENNQWLNKDDTPTDKLNKLITQKEKEMQTAFDNSRLPDKPDTDKLNELVIKINSDIVTDSWK